MSEERMVDECPECKGTGKDATSVPALVSSNNYRGRRGCKLEQVKRARRELASGVTHLKYELRRK